MKKSWNVPEIGKLNLNQTERDITVWEESDGLFAGEQGEGSPDGYKCPLCS